MTQPQSLTGMTVRRDKLTERLTLTVIFFFLRCRHNSFFTTNGQTSFVVTPFVVQTLCHRKLSLDSHFTPQFTTLSRAVSLCMGAASFASVD